MLQGSTENVRGVECLAWSRGVHVDPERPENVGDRFGPVILDQLAAGLRGPLDPTPHRRVLSVGSVLHFAELGDIVWGSGVNGKIVPDALPAWLDVRAVRGPYTRAALLACGIPVLGSKIGDGSGRYVGTAVGSMVGGMAGRSIYDNTQRNRQVRRGTVRVCDPEPVNGGYNGYDGDGRVSGYDVTYEYANRTYHTRTSYHPGDRIRVRVDVRPE